jgi:CHAD domain-containing protein
MPEGPGGPPRADPPLRLRREIESLVNRVDRLVEETVGHAHPPVALLRDLHRQMRRLAVSLAVWGRLLSAADEERVRPVVKRLRRLARLVGRVRDKDVTAGLLAPVRGGTKSVAERLLVRRFLGRIHEDARTGRELLKAYLTTARGAGALGQAREALLRPLRRGLQTGVPALLSREAGVFERRLLKSLRRARRTPSPERLHRLRIRIRQLRQFAGLAGRSASPRRPPLPRGLKDLQVRLGRLHDLDVALATLPPGLEGSSLGRRLRARRRRTRRSIRTELGHLRLPRETPPRARAGRQRLTPPGG